MAETNASFQQPPPGSSRLPFNKSKLAFLQDIIASARIKSQGQGNTTARQTPQKGRGYSQNRDLQQLMSSGKRKRENLVLTSYDGTRRKTFINGQPSFMQDTATLKTPQSSILEDNNSTGCTNLGGKSRGQFFLDRYQQNKSSQRGSLDTVRMGGNQSLVALPSQRSELTQDLRSSNRSTEQSLRLFKDQQKQMLYQTQGLSKQPADLAISSANFTIRRGSNNRGGGEVAQPKFQQSFMPQIISDSFSSEGVPQTLEQINPPIKIVTEGGNAINDSKFMISLAPSPNISTTEEEQYSITKGGGLLNLDFLPQPASISQQMVSQILSPRHVGGNRIVAVDQSLHVKGGSQKMRESMEHQRSGHQALNAHSRLKVMTAQRERSNGTTVNESANTQASVEVSNFLMRTQQQNMATESKLNENSNTLMFDSQISNEQSMNQNHNPGIQRLSSIFQESNIGKPRENKQLSINELKNSINQWKEMPSITAGRKDIDNTGQQYTNGILHNQLEPIITPELASKVVKNYLLPMFASKRRINQSSSAIPQQSPKETNHIMHPRLSKKIKLLNTTARKLSPTENAPQSSIQSSHHQQNQSFVVSELQLNQELYNKLKQAEQLFLDAEEKLEAQLQANRLLTRQIEQLRRDHEKMKIENRTLTQKSSKQETECMKNSIVIQQQEQRLAFYAKLYGQSEHNRKEVSSRCNELQSALDHDKNQVNSSKARCNLLEIEHEYVKNQLQLIYDSFASMTSTKLVSDHYEFEMIKLNKRITESDQMKRELEKALLESNLKNDQLMRHIKDVKELFQSSIKKRDVQVNETQEALKTCEEQRSALDTELTDTKNRLHEAESNFKMAALEIVGLRKRIDKMKQMSLKMFAQKICRNCLKEYNESENYNWSCRTHQGEYGGVIWWCCGRKNKDDPGCKYSKHESRDETNENAGKSKLNEANNVDLSSIFQDYKTYNKDEHVRCYCCKKLGHSGNICNKDPNFKTLASNNLVESVNQDELRILKNIEEEEKRKGINRLDLFNRYVQHQLETAQKLNKHAAAVQALMNYSVSPKRGGPLVNQAKSNSRRSFSTSDKLALTGTNRDLNDSQSNAGGQATPQVAHQTDAIPSARTKSIAIVNDLKKFLLTFDDFNYSMINQQVVNKVETFKLDLQNPTETHTMEFDMANLQLLELHQAQSPQVQGSSSNVNVTPKNSSTNIMKGGTANPSPMNRQEESASNKSTFYKKNGAPSDAGFKKQRTIRSGLQSSFIITGSDTSSVKEDNASEKQPPLKHSKTMKKDSKSKQQVPPIKGQSGKKPLFDIDEEQFDDHDQQHIEAPKVQLVEIDIEEIKQMQQKEPFEELYDMKVLLSAQQKFLESSNLINILSYFQANKPKDNTRESRFQGGGGSSQQKRTPLVGKRNTNMFSDSSSNNQRLGGADMTSVDNNSSYQQQEYWRGGNYQRQSSRNLDLASLVIGQRDYGGMPDPIPEETHSQAEISPQWKNQNNQLGPAQNLVNDAQISQFEPAKEPDQLHAVQLKQFLGLSDKDGRNIEELSKEPSNSSPKFGEGSKPTNQIEQRRGSILKPKPAYMKPHAQHSRKSIRLQGAILSETLAEINKKNASAATVQEEGKPAQTESVQSTGQQNPKPQQAEQPYNQLLKNGDGKVTDE